MEVFPDPVKNNNRSVNGVANHRKERRHKGRIHFKLQKGEPTERDHDVDDKGDNGGKGKVMLKADRDVDEQLFAWAQEWAEFYNQKVEQLHPEKKTSLDDKLNKLMYDTVNRMATEISNATSVLLLK